MLRFRRHAWIIEELHRTSFVEISKLSASLGTDRSTIRRDLQDLERRGLAVRTRGGAWAIATGVDVDVPYAVKRGEHIADKQAIGRLAASLVRPSESLILDSGSTTYQVAVALRDRPDVSVVTNDLRIATYLAERPRAQLLVTGGVLLESVYTLVGPQTIEHLRAIHVDRVFLGADAVHSTGGITNRTVVEVDVKRAMIASAREVVVVADSSKFETRALTSVCSLAEVGTVVTDDRLKPEIRALYDGDIRIMEAETGESESGRAAPEMASARGVRPDAWDGLRNPNEAVGARHGPTESA